MKRCRHASVRTVELEIDTDGDVYQRTTCGDLTGTLGCGNTLNRGGAELLGNADVGQSMWLRVGKRRFSITIKDVTP